MKISSFYTPEIILKSNLKESYRVVQYDISVVYGKGIIFL